jgi:hypothetical protein
LLLAEVVVVGQAERAVARLAVLLLAVALVAELDPARRAVPAPPE